MVADIYPYPVDLRLFFMNKRLVGLVFTIHSAGLKPPIAWMVERGDQMVDDTFRDVVAKTIRETYSPRPTATDDPKYPSLQLKDAGGNEIGVGVQPDTGNVFVACDSADYMRAWNGGY
jgi:hypothetical protein